MNNTEIEWDVTESITHMVGRLENQTVTLALRRESSKNPGTALSWKYSDQGAVAKMRELKTPGFPLQDPCCEGQEEEEGSRVLASVMGVRDQLHSLPRPPHVGKGDFSREKSAAVKRGNRYWEAKTMTKIYHVTYFLP